MEMDEESEKPQTVNKKRNQNPFHVKQQKEDKEKRRQKRARIIIRNISYKTTDDTLRKHFEKYGNIVDLNILKRPDGKLVGCAFIQYEKVNEAAKAILKTSNKPFLERPIYVDWALGKSDYEKKKNIKVDSNVDAVKQEIKEEIEEESIKNEDVKENKSDEDSDDENSGSEISEADDSDNEMKDDTDDMDEESIEDDNEDDKSNIKIEKHEKKISNDVTEGCTVFIKNVPLDATDNDIRKICVKYGPVYYALINKHPISNYSKGTAFVKFKTKESADLCLASGEQFVFMDTVMQPLPALSRNDIVEQSSKQTETKDSRNLYLAKEGLIMSGSKSAEGVSAADMAKRHKLEQMKSSVLKDLNRFVSRNRLSIHNLPLHYDNDKLRALVIQHTHLKPHECRVMRENKPSPGYPNGKPKGFGFMSFNTHLDALNALRKLNNNPSTFGAKNRPIVAFSIEDRTVHNIKQKRLEKSRENNPNYKRKLEKIKERRGKKKLNKNLSSKDDKKIVKKNLNIKRRNNVTEENQSEYVGAPAKKGSFIRMRSNKKIREQSMEHKKKASEAKRKEKNKRERRMHLMERKQTDRTKIGKKKKQPENDNFSKLVNKYKSLVDSTAANEVKLNKKIRKKWYVE